LRRIAARLKTHGFSFVAAVKDLGTAAALAHDGIELVQAPLWNAPQSSATLGDTLADVGFGDPQVLRPRIEVWSGIIDQYKPTLVISIIRWARTWLCAGVFRWLSSELGSPYPRRKWHAFHHCIAIHRRSGTRGRFSPA